jgi:hypothetical protein
MENHEIGYPKMTLDSPTSAKVQYVRLIKEGELRIIMSDQELHNLNEDSRWLNAQLQISDTGSPV